MECERIYLVVLASLGDRGLRVESVDDHAICFIFRASLARRETRASVHQLASRSRQGGREPASLCSRRPHASPCSSTRARRPIVAKRWSPQSADDHACTVQRATCQLPTTFPARQKLCYFGLLIPEHVRQIRVDSRDDVILCCNDLQGENEMTVRAQWAE